MHEKTRALQAAFPYTIPVMTGYLFLGFAFGLLMHTKGYHAGWSIIMSIFIYAGAMQFVAANLLTSAFNPISAFFITLIINARHLFYGIAMLANFRAAEKKKPYLVFGLTDETFSILCSTQAPAGVNQVWFMFFVTLLNQIYWIVGSALGGMLGTVISFNSQGIEFVMTALFVVIFINQWRDQQQHSPALIGLGVSALCLMVFGAQNFIIPAMVIIIVVLTMARKKLEKEEAGKI